MTWATAQGKQGRGEEHELERVLLELFRNKNTRNRRNRVLLGTILASE